MKTKNKIRLEWTGCADDVEIKDYAESNEIINEETKELDIEKAERMIGEDSDYWTIQWESFTEYLTELMKGQEYWRSDATNMGWRHLTGYREFKATTGEEFIRAISPNDSDCSYQITPHYKGFKIRIAHHDAPMGEHHLVTPMTAKNYELAS